MSDQSTESALGRPRKRWRKTKWFYGIVLAYVAVTIVAAVSWFAYSHRKFREAVDPIIARGEPLEWSDFATDPIPDEQNAAILYKQAIERGVLKDSNGQYPSEFSSDAEPWSWEYDEMLHRFTTEREVRRKYSKELQKLLGMAREAFAYCRKARRLDKIHWGIDFSGKAYDEFGPSGVGMYRDIAGLLHLAAIEAHESGRDDDAVEYIRDLVALGDCLAAYPGLTEYFVSHSINSIANEALEDILPGMKIGDASGSAPLENTRSLVDRLLDDARPRRGMLLAMMGERSFRYDICQSILSLDLPTEYARTEFGGVFDDYCRSSTLVRVCYDYCLAPVFRVDAARAVKRSDSYVRAFSSETLPQYRRSIRQTDRDTEELFENASFSRSISTMLTSSWTRLCDMHYRYLAMRQMAGVALAVRVYQVDRGRRPDKLEELVPDYLAEISQDPMDEPGRQIRYVNDSKAPRLYCVGLDGRDDGGVYDDQGEHEDDHKETLFFLSGRPNVAKEETDEDDSDDIDSDR